LSAHFEDVARTFAENEDKIVAELNAAQGASQDIGGYYLPDAGLAERAMRPSATFNSIIAGL